MSSKENKSDNSVSHSSLDIERYYQFEYNDINFDLLAKKPRIVAQGEQGEFSKLPTFQRPIRCPQCHHMVVRDTTVVDNRVVCPNNHCKQSFCWICRGKAEENDFICDHFSWGNLTKCNGLQYRDVRQEKRCGKLCCGRVA